MLRSAVSGAGTSGYRNIPHGDMPWILAVPSVRIYGAHRNDMGIRHATNSIGLDT